MKVANYHELRECINSLPPPAPGLVRVFRGQDQNWPLLPSGRRREIPRADIWAHYLRRKMFSIERTGVYDDLDREFQIWLLWLPALAQHYGAGSNYLDVSHDLGVATWFALHSSKWVHLESVVGPPNTTDQDSLIKTSWLRLIPHTHNAFLYVLDLKPWSGEGMVEPGEVVDLAQAPDLFHSERIRVQSGCLAYAKEQQDIGKEFSVPGTPIEMDGDFSDAPYFSWTVENIFPAPAVDDWYARFLSLPFLLSPDEKGAETFYSQSLPIQLFLSEPDSPFVADIRSRFHYLLPAFVYPDSDTPVASGASEWWTTYNPDEATVIVLEGPQISAHPPVESPLWNHDLLLSDWVPEVETFDLVTKGINGTVQIENVVIEFSPLEEVDWDQPHDGGQLLRAMWILRASDDQLAAYALYQDYPGFKLAQAGPILLRVNPDSLRFEWRASKPDATWKDIAELGGLGKAIISCLVLLRDLSPLPKMAPYPDLRTDAPNGESLVMRVSAAAARLFSVAGSTNARPWFLLRDSDNDPYTIARPNVGTIQIETAKPFGKMPASQLKQLLTAGMEKGK